MPNPIGEMPVVLAVFLAAPALPGRARALFLRPQALPERGPSRLVVPQGKLARPQDRGAHRRGLWGCLRGGGATKQGGGRRWCSLWTSEWGVWACQQGLWAALQRGYACPQRQSSSRRDAETSTQDANSVRHRSCFKRRYISRAETLRRRERQIAFYSDKRQNYGDVRK